MKPNPSIPSGSLAWQGNQNRRSSWRAATSARKSRIEVGILGATGTVGQQFAALLTNHPWFRVTWLAASDRSAGKRYGELPWRLATLCAAETAQLSVETLKPGIGPKLVFSALDPSVAGEAEEEFAAAGHWVISNARNHRMDPLVPLLVPEINPEHLGLISHQQKSRGWRGAIATNPNCASVFLAMALAALRQFRPRRVLVTTLQALSGAGYPGVASLDATANVIPFISGEEEKLETETRKILGRFVNDSVEPLAVAISAQSTRVPVVHGHTETVSVEFEETASRDDILAAFREFSGEPQRLGLPSAPAQPIVYLDGSDRPQPRLDVENFGGMAVQVGRLRECPVLGYKFVLLGHNTIRGAAGAALLNAELISALRMLN
ncbi:MAG TPA: aspartate-semialdehyde dehydrogenase [Candidatus Acidoferrales bacterium]|nr:aspartate-semialdehyde dehydrogenase [Candidatus Acidoferrales bacterium]